MNLYITESDIEIYNSLYFLNDDLSLKQKFNEIETKRNRDKSVENPFWVEESEWFPKTNDPIFFLHTLILSNHLFAYGFDTILLKPLQLPL
jgi:hypothetical protein